MKLCTFKSKVYNYLYNSDKQAGSFVSDYEREFSDYNDKKPILSTTNRLHRLKRQKSDFDDHK